MVIANNINNIQIFFFRKIFPLYLWPSLVAQMVKNQRVMQETWVQSLGQEDPLEKGMATHSSILAWRIPWTGEPARLQSMRSQWVRHNWATNTHTQFGCCPFPPVTLERFQVSVRKGVFLGVVRSCSPPDVQILPVHKASVFHSPPPPSLLVILRLIIAL